MAKTLVIIGGGIEQISAYEKAKARGYTVVGTDMNPHAPAFAYADSHLLASTRDPEETLAAVKKFHKTHPVDGIMTIANDVPLTVATVATALGLPSISLDAARAASDKLLMKRRFVEHGVPCPWFQAMDHVEELRTLIAANPDKRYVLKPIDGRGARGVLLLDKTMDLDWAFAESQRWGDAGRVMVEEFIPYGQVSTESFILDGVCYTAAYSERNYDRLQQFAPNIIEDGGTMPAQLTLAQRAQFDAVILAGAKAMGIDRGIVKGDLVMDAEGNALIIELAARLSGGWFATHMIPAGTGIDLVEAVISNALGETISPESLKPTRNKGVALRYWFPPPGRIEAIEGEAELRALPGLIHYGFFRKPGDIQPPVLSHPDRFGYVLVTADTYDEAIALVNRALDTLKIKVTAAKS